MRAIADVVLVLLCTTQRPHVTPEEEIIECAR